MFACLRYVGGADLGREGDGLETLPLLYFRDADVGPAPDVEGEVSLALLGDDTFPDLATVHGRVQDEDGTADPPLSPGKAAGGGLVLHLKGSTWFEV